MKSIAKFLIPFSVFLILLGMLITSISLFNGARWRDNPMLNRVYSLTDGTRFSNHWFGDGHGFWNDWGWDWDWDWDDDDYSNNNNNSNTGTSFFGSDSYINTFSENINSLDFDITMAELEIIEGDSFSIDARNINKSKFTCEVKNGTWHLEEKKENYNNNVFGFGHNKKHSIITITIPKNYNFNDIDIETNMGNIEIDKIIANNSELTCNMGSIDIYDLETKDISVNCSMGDITVTGKVENDGDIDCDMGNLKMYLTGAQSDYSYKIDCGMGNLSINDTNFGAIQNQVITNKDAKGNMDLKTGMGNLQIIIREE